MVHWRHERQVRRPKLLCFPMLYKVISDLILKIVPLLWDNFAKELQNGFGKLFL